MVRVLRQDGPGQKGYWQRFRVPYEADMNCISVLQKIARLAVTADGRPAPPVAWECNCLEEVCGACTMLINGRVRQACTALVDQLLRDRPEAIELRPMTKFPVLRDLVVDRSRMFELLKKILAWVPVDSYLDLGPGPRQSQETQQMAYRYSRCMTCGCCLEACPQFLKIELRCREGETAEEFDARFREQNMRAFMGAHAIAQVELFNSNPIGAMNATERLDALVAEGGIQVCGNAQNCQKVCPKEVPLFTAIGRGGRAATLHMLRKWFDR
ncbi:MAG: succinate dehydrogenase iron-sulfur subunit [Thermoguttaceae bacterium]|jgi:succinate dehydrogenase / fumarate reductase iron-sulfur subunit